MAVKQLENDRHLVEHVCQQLFAEPLLQDNSQI
jgi:hypothetical protein